jgi:hypothetical protein
VKVRLPKLTKRQREQVRRRRGLDAAQLDEYRRCAPTRGASGFFYWLQHFCVIYDYEKKRPVKFDPFAGQRRLIPDLATGVWLVILKGRQLGVTWLIAAWALYNITFRSTYNVSVVFQQLEYAYDFIWRIKYMYERLPQWQRKAITDSNKRTLGWRADGSDCRVRAFAGSPRAGRSLTGDLIVLDEASRIPYLADVMQALEPTIEVGSGQFIQLSTSAGPQGIFYEVWQETYGDYGELLDERGVGPSGFKPVFLHWSERRGRDHEWYAREKRRLDRISPVAMKQEHPDNPQEAFEFAAGRVYPLFTRERCIGDIEIPTTGERYRAIDWGQSASAQVCLWLAHVPGPPGVLVSPKCPNTIREFFAYRYDDERPGEVLKVDDHCPDAVRYAVVTFRLTGLVYVYRELYIKDSVARGWNPMTEIAEIHELSGWERAEPKESYASWVRGRRGEAFEGTVADRSWPKMIALFNLHDLYVRPHEPIRGKKGKKGLLTDPPLRETKEGIRLVSALIEGSACLDRLVDVTRDAQALTLLADHEGRSTPGVSHSLSHTALLAAAKRLRKAKARRTP